MEEREAVRVFKALGDEKRLRILSLCGRRALRLRPLRRPELVPADLIPSHEDSL